MISSENIGTRNLKENGPHVTLRFLYATYSGICEANFLYATCSMIFI